MRAVGTTNYLADVETQSRIRTEPRESSRGWDMVHGELFSFDDPEERLPAFDGLEGFRPGEESLYERVLIPTTLARTDPAILAWTYVVDSASGLHLPGGRWPPP